MKFATREEGETFPNPVLLLFFIQKLEHNCGGLVVCGSSINSSHVYCKKREIF